MSAPPIRFEQQFSRMKGLVNEAPSGALRMLALIDFWPMLQTVLKRPAFDSHVEEYTAMLLDHCRERHISDLNPNDLQTIGRALTEIGSLPSRISISRDIKQHAHTVLMMRSKKLLYAGDIESGLASLHELLGSSLPAVDVAGFGIPNDVDELDALRLVCEPETEGDHPVFRQAIAVLAEWEWYREQVFDDRANCLFVEKDYHRRLAPGCLRKLTGSVRYSGARAQSHEIIFEHQIRSPDDPFVGVTYDALAAVRRLMSGPGFSRQQKQYIHAHFRIHESEHAFTGDSIGLAAALVVFTQLRKQEIARHERGLAHCAAFTGAVDASGNVLAVNERTLPSKIERAFFSPVKYLIVPEPNETTAENVLMELKEKYPRRQLLLVAANRLEDIVRNYNIVREEKVCTGRYMMRKAHTYGRLVKVQVPLLLILLYVLVCLAYPKAWIGFDHNPEIVRMNEARDRVLVFNRDSDFLWGRNCDCSPVSKLYAEACDIDSDNRNEVVYMHQIDEDVPCTTSAMLSAYDDNGELLFTRMGNIVGEYPGDTISTQNYRAKHLFVLESTRGPVIVTNYTQNNPARSHLKIWSAEGDLLGWYVHSGHIYNAVTADVNGDGDREILGIGINNRMAGGSGFFILPGKGALGVSPPYEDASIDLSNVKRGNQLHYILFPISDLARADSVAYGGGALIAVLPGGQLRLDILTHSNFDSGFWRSFYLDSKMRVYKVSASDNFWARRQKFVEGGYLPAMDVDNFCRWELGRVRYWSDSGWVSQGPQDNSQ